ncbi:uncharacterized protein LOC144432029 [Styela clava]
MSFDNINNELEKVVGFRLDDIGKIDPFKDTYSIVWFCIFVGFIGTVVILIGIACLYSICDCLCACCCKKRRRVGERNIDQGHDNIAMEHVEIPTKKPRKNVKSAQAPPPPYRP